MRSLDAIRSSSVLAVMSAIFSFEIAVVIPLMVPNRPAISPGMAKNAEMMPMARPLLRWAGGRAEGDRRSGNSDVIVIAARDKMALVIRFAAGAPGHLSDDAREYKPRCHVLGVANQRREIDRSQDSPDSADEHLNTGEPDHARRVERAVES